MKLLWRDAIDRAHGAAEYVVGSFELAGTFERNDVERFFDYSDKLLVPARIAIKW